MCLIQHPLCSLDLFPSGYFLFEKLKIPLIRTRFENIEVTM